jgi:hypothetical protein
VLQVVQDGCRWVHMHLCMECNAPYMRLSRCIMWWGRLQSQQLVTGCVLVGRVVAATAVCGQAQPVLCIKMSGCFADGGV